MTGCGGSPPRDPSRYERSNHFGDSMEDSMRFLTEEMIDKTLSDGKNCDRIEAGPGKLRRKYRFEGIDAVLVLPEHEPVLVTGWTEIGCLEEALTSERWSFDDIQVIEAFENELHKQRITALDDDWG